MKRLFGLKKKKIKIGGDEDEEQNNDTTNTTNSHHNKSYSPPSVGSGTINSGSSSAYDFQQVNDKFPNVNIVNSNNNNNSSSAPSADLPIHQRNNDNNEPNIPIGAGYRYALTAYNDTINPALSNEDGMGGGGGTLRSRLKGSGGKNNRSLIPSFQPLVDDSGEHLQRNTHNWKDTKGWSPIPEEPRSTSSGSTSPNNRKEDEGVITGEKKSSSERVVTFDSSIEEYSGGQQVIIPPSSTRSTHTSSQSFSPPSNNTTTSSSSQQSQQQHPMMIILQPDAIYEEKYGDAYIDQLPKYLYPSGYQSMRPRSGPWKLSMFIFCLFLWLSVFIVGHCYDRGKQYVIDDDGASNYNYDDANNNGDNNNNNNNAVDDAYLEEVDDDAVLMETRWCGSKLLHFMWMLSVAITVLAMSYCSIIGYVKVRDIAVAAGRSQPAGMFDGGEDGDGGGGGGWKSDYYSKVDNVSGSSGATTGENDQESGSNLNNSNNNDQYSSYQAGGDGDRRYEPSIYQSNGMPQFLGGHIYRPTQAAITMTNRP